MRRSCSWAAIAAASSIALSARAVAAQAPERRPSEPIPFEDTRPDPDVQALPPEFLPGGVDDLEVEAEPPPWILDLQGFYGFSIRRYNRIDGLVPAWGLDVEATEPDRRPDLGAEIGIATTHSRAYWSAWVEQRLPLPGAIRLRFEHFQRGATFDDWKISVRENDVATFVAGSDLLDWWRERGYSIDLHLETAGGRYGGTLSLLDATQRSEPNRSPFALLADDHDFRDNPAVAEGTLRSLSLGLWLDTRDVQSPLLPSPGWVARIGLERAGGALGGDVAFSRAELDLRRYLRLGRDTWWDSRLVWLGPLTDRGVPAQRKVSLGGPGSLRGFRAASFVADEGVLGSSEFRVPLPVTDAISLLFLTWHAVGFVDVGSVGDYEDWHADVGAGVSGINIFSYLGFFVAQRVTDQDEPDSGPRFLIRLRRDF